MNPGPAPADEAQAPDSVRYFHPAVTVVSSRFEKNPLETHLPVQSLGAGEMRVMGFATAVEAACLASGAAETGTGPWTGRWALRGLSGPRVLVLVDGLRLDILRGYGEHPPLVDADAVRAVEIVRGPASVLYGSDAVAGAVNLVTDASRRRGPGTGPWSGHAAAQFHSVNAQWNASASLRRDGRRSHAAVRFSRRRAGELGTPMGPLRNTGFDGWSAAGEAGLDFAGRGRFFVSGQADRMDGVGVPTDPYAASARFTAYDRNRLVVSLERRAAGRRGAGFRLDLYGQDEFRNFDARIERKPRTALFVDQDLAARRRVKAAGASAQATFASSGGHWLAVGTDAFAHRIRSERFADALLRHASGAAAKDPPPDTAPPLPRCDEAAVGIFGTGEFAASKRVTLQLGLRRDGARGRARATPGTLAERDVPVRGVEATGNAGVLVRAGAIRFTANAGRAFRAPALEERFFRGPGQTGFVTGEPSLRPETSLNLDAGVKWKGGRFEGEFALFRNRVDRLIVLAAASAARDTFRYANVGRARLAGGEFRGSWRAAGDFVLSLDVSAVRGGDLESGLPLPRIAPAQARFSADWTAGSGDWRLGAALRCRADQDRVAENELRTPGYALADLYAACRLRPAWNARRPVEFSLSVNNCLNRGYRDHLSSVTWWQGPGRNVTAGLRAEY